MVLLLQTLVLHVYHQPNMVVVLVVSHYVL